MITIQRVRVRWTAAGRGARAANTRRGLDRPVTLPASLPNAEVVVHEVLADEAVRYTRHAEVLTGELQRASDVGLWLGFEGAAVIVQRLPGSAAYPPPRRPARLFTLQPGQVGRYKANFRFTGCACNPSWYYESWTVHIGNGGMDADRFVHANADHAVDDRVHLYGGTPPPGRRSRRRMAGESAVIDSDRAR